MVDYFYKKVEVSQEVADFLEWDRKRSAAEKKRIERHIVYCDFDKVTNLAVVSQSEDILDSAIHNLQVQALLITIQTLSQDERHLLFLRFWRDMTMQGIGGYFKISKMAVSKRLKKLLAFLREELEKNYKEIF